MQDDKTENLIDIKKWTNDFCQSLKNKDSEIPLFAAQLDIFIDQILNCCELNAPNTDSTNYFLETSIPLIIDTIINNTSPISDPEMKQTFVFIIANLTLLFQWIFSSDYFQLYHSFFPVFNENSLIYKNNNGGQKPSGMWIDSMKKFIDLYIFQLIMSRFQEGDIQIEHFYTCFQIFSFLIPTFDTKPTIEIGAELFQDFQDFLNDLNTENFEQRVNSCETLLNSINSMSNIMGIIHDKSSILSGIISFLHLLQVLNEINDNSTLQAAFTLISFLINFNSNEVNDQLKSFILESNLYKKTSEIPTSIFKLIINDISIDDLLNYLLSLSKYNNIDKTLLDLEPEKMDELIVKIPKDNTKIPPLLISTSCLAASSKSELTNIIITKSFDNLNLSNVKSTEFLPLYDQYQSQLSEICIKHINENNNDINLPLILNIFCEMVKRKPSILTDDAFQQIFMHITEEGNTALFPILDKAFVNSKRVMSKEQLVMLLKIPDHQPIWNLFNDMIKARGPGSFDSDISTLVFYNFKDKSEDDKDNNKNSENILISNDDLTNQMYIDFVFNYAICVNLKDKNIQIPHKFSFGSYQPLKFGSSWSTASKNKQTNQDDSKTQNKDTVAEWIPQQFTVINWPLTYFDNLLQLVIFNESILIENNKKDKSDKPTNKLINNIAHSDVYQKLFNMLKNINKSLTKPIIQTMIEILSSQTENNSFYITLSFLFEFSQNKESSICLRDYGIIQHFAVNIPYECDLPNEVTVTYDKQSQIVRYDPCSPLGDVLRAAALKFGSANKDLALRNQVNKMLSNQILPKPDPEGYKMTGRLTPIIHDEIPSYILSSEEVSFNSFLLTKLMDNLPPETENLIESFLEYLPTDLQIQDLIFNIDDFIESLKIQTSCFSYFYMIKAAIHRSKSKELVSLYNKSQIFFVIKDDYLKARFEHKNDHLMISFLISFFNDNEIDFEMIKRLDEELRNIKNYCGDNRKAMELMFHYGKLSKEIESKTEKNILSDYLIENNLVEPLITTCNDSIKKSMTSFIKFIIPYQFIYDLFLKNPGNSKIAEVLLSILQEFLKQKDEEERDQIIKDFINKFSSFNDVILKQSLDILLSKNIVKANYVDQMLQVSMIIPREPMRSNVINIVIDFCVGDLKLEQNDTKTQSLAQSLNNKYQYYSQNQQLKSGIIIPDDEYKKCAYDFLEKITKITYVGDDLYNANPIRSNVEYVRQELFHLKPIRDCLLNPDNQDYFVGNETAHKLQLYFSKMILDNPPQYMYVKSNTLSPYKHLTNMISKVFSPEMRDQLITFVPSQCIVDTSIFETLETATPAIIVHLTHYAPSNIPLDIKVKNERYNLTGIIVKQKNFMNQGMPNPQDENGIVDFQKNVYRTIVLEGGNWLIYQDQFINRIDEQMLYPIFQAEFEATNMNSLKPYVLFYTKESIINQFTIDFNQSPIIKYSEMLHFQNKNELPKAIVDEIEASKLTSAIDSFAVSNTAANLFDRRADPVLLFTYFVNIYCRSTQITYSNQFRDKMLKSSYLYLPSLDLILSLIDPICQSFKQMTQINFIDTLASVISMSINRNLTPDYKDKENMSNYEKVLQIITKLSELFPQLQYNFTTQSKISKIFHSFILSTNTFTQNDENDESNEIDSYSVCLSLNIPSMIYESITSNFSKTRSLNYITVIDANDILHCLLSFVEMLGSSLHDLLVHISQIQASNANNFYLLLLEMKCVKYGCFTFDELKGVAIDSDQTFSNINISNMLINGIMALNTDQEMAEMADIFFRDDILICFLNKLILTVSGNKSLMMKLVQISSLFFINLFNYNNNEIRSKAFALAVKLIDGEDNFTGFTVKLADHFNSELSLLLINQIITTTICDHQLIAQHLLKRASQVSFIDTKQKKDDDDDDNDNNGITEVADSTDIFASLEDENDDIDDNQEGNQFANAFFKVLENLSIKDVDKYIPFIVTKVTTVDNLRFFIKNFDEVILSEFEKNEEEIIPRISIYKYSLKQPSTVAIESKQKVEKGRLAKLEGYELVSEFINCVLSINPQSSIIKKIIINEKRGYVPYEFVQFIPAISSATKQEEIERYLPPKILFTSLNYSIAKANKTIEKENNKKDNENNILIGVQYFLDILLRHHKEFSFSRLFLNIPDVCEFTSKFGNTKECQELIQLIKIDIKQNKVFREMLEDEIETQLKRNSEVPNLEVMKMEIDLDLDFDKVKNNVDKVADKIVEKHKAAVQRSITRSTSIELDSPYKLDTSDYLYHYYLSKHFEETPVAFGIFPYSMLSSDVEKQFFTSALKDYNDDDFLEFCKNYIKSSKTLSPITFDNLDMKRLWFLMQLKPELAEKIKKMIPVDRRRVIMMLKLMPDGQAYAQKVFNITNEEIGITDKNDENNNDNDENLNLTDSAIQRESQSAPSNLAHSNEIQNRPPPANNNNTSTDDSTANPSKPYFFRRPAPPKKP